MLLSAHSRHALNVSAVSTESETPESTDFTVRLLLVMGPLSIHGLQFLEKRAGVMMTDNHRPLKFVAIYGFDFDLLG